MTIKKFTVDRATWHFGEVPPGRAMLLNPYGYKCCLGFLAEACGVPPDNLEDIDTLFSLISLHKDVGTDKLLPRAVVDSENDFADINDDTQLDREKREATLIALFADHDIELKFTGEYPDKY